MYDLMIIGGGPAGLCAAVYAARKMLKTLLISVDFGGQPNTTTGIENYLGYQFIEGPELISKFYSQVKQFPLEQKIGAAVTRLDKVKRGFEAVTDAGERFQASAVIFATGKKPKKLNVPGEAEFAGKGVTYCEICDGPIFSGQKVAVIGGGNSALEAALDLLKMAEHVNLVSLTTLTGDPLLINRLDEAKNVTVFTQHQVESIEGKDFVQSINIKNLLSGEKKKLEVTGVFVEIGLVPNSEAIKHLIHLNKAGEVPVSCMCETTMPGLFAAGDVTDVPEKQIIIAAGEGAKAALQAHRYLQHV